QDLVIGRDRLTYRAFDKENVDFDSVRRGYDAGERQVPGKDAAKASSFRDDRVTFTEEQVKKETARCLGCGATIVDANKCIGCGLCTTRCEFDAIHLLRDHPQNSDMRRAEDKVGGLLGYAAKRAVKIVLHSGSQEAKIMRKKRKEYNKATKEFHKTHPHTGNSVSVEELMKD
ncbi:MAG: 4Fe-4S binding protein, partial [Clostridia bacterium]|nr:4Fe-4S binding protein [Clostridia bacterium]